jgi:hypothetical protein
MICVCLCIAVCFNAVLLYVHVAYKIVRKDTESVGEYARGELNYDNMCTIRANYDSRG